MSLENLHVPIILIKGRSFTYHHISNFFSHDYLHHMYHAFTLSLSWELLESEVDKPAKILIKISNAVEYSESNIHNFKVSRTNDPII